MWSLTLIRLIIEANCRRSDFVPESRGPQSIRYERHIVFEAVGTEAQRCR